MKENGKGDEPHGRQGADVGDSVQGSWSEYQEVLK
jgi:hypothetical protein